MTRPDDPLDPAERADAVVERRRRRERARRRVVALLAVGTAIAGPPVAGAVLGEGGTVGAVVGACVLLACALATWPQDWSPAEAEHHRLAAIWDQARPQTAEDVPWDRFAAWARADGERVSLLVVRRLAASPDGTGPPSPYTERVDRCVDADDPAVAAEAMEGLREHVRDLETRARAEYEAALSSAERHEQAEALARLDAAAEDELRRREEELRREVAAAEAAERREQAAAVARALRR